MPRSRSGRPTLAFLATLAAWAACVSYDPTGPHAAPLNGIFDATLVTVLRNDVEVRQDTAILILTLRDSMYRGRFYGGYRFTDGDSGLMAGTLRDGGHVWVTHFGTLTGYWPPLTDVDYIERLYPSCDFLRLGPIYILMGTMRADTLAVNALGIVPCRESTPGGTVERDTEFAFDLVGKRR